MFGYRKLAVVLIYFIVTAIFLKQGHYSGEAWLKYSATVLGAFMGANLFEHFGGKK